MYVSIYPHCLSLRTVTDHLKLYISFYDGLKDGWLETTSDERILFLKWELIHSLDDASIGYEITTTTKISGDLIMGGIKITSNICKAKILTNRLEGVFSDRLEI